MLSKLDVSTASNNQSELDSLLVKLKDYTGLHVEEFIDQDEGDRWIVVSR